MADQTPTIDANKISSFQFCPYSYSLEQRLEEEGIKEEELPITAFSAKTLWLKDVFRKLVKKEYRGHPVHTAETEELREYLKYKSPETFSNAMFHFWRTFVIDKKAKVNERDVVWAYFNQWWDMAHEAKKACFNYYDLLLKQGMHIQAYCDKDVAFVFDGKKYALKFDAVWPGMKIGSFKMKKRTKKELNNDWQITLQLLAYHQLAHEFDAYRVAWGIDSKTAEAWGGKERYIDERIKYMYWRLSDGDVYETSRNDGNLERMFSTIAAAERGIAERDFAPNTKGCYACRYNLYGKDRKPLCKMRNPKTPLMQSREILEAKKL